MRLMINGLRLPPFIATLATMAGLRSLATLLCQNKTINVSFDAYRALGKEAWVTLSIFACVAVFMSILMGWTVLGRHLFALGGNETAARLSGLRTNRLKAVAYGLSGTLSALGGILFTGYERAGRQPPGHDLRADRHHGGGRRRLQPLGRGRLDPRHGPGPAAHPDRAQGNGHRRHAGSTAPRSRGSCWGRSCCWPWRSTSDSEAHRAGKLDRSTPVFFGLSIPGH